MRAFLYLSLLLGILVQPAFGANLSDMYAKEVLQNDAKRLRTAVGKIYELGLKPSLSRSKRNGMGDVEFRFPMPRPGYDPLNFYAYRDGTKAIVVMPILSLKALEDLTTA